MVKTAFRKIINLDTEMFASASHIYKAVRIHGNNINREIVLLQLNIILILL